VTERAGYWVLAGSLAIFSVCGALIVWRTAPPSARAPQPTEQVQTAPPKTVLPARTPTTPVRISTIIDRPGDPVLVPRAATVAPRSIEVSLPIKVAASAPKVESEAYFVATRLASTDGGYMGKFPEAGQDADAYAAQLTENVAMIAGRPDPMEADAGTDDDGGADTPEGAQPQLLTDQNSNRLGIAPAQRPQIKQAILKTVVPEKIADLLVENGFSEDSANATETVAKALYKLQTLPAQSVAVAIGALDASGAYRVTQFAIYLDREYYGAVALADDGEYSDAAQPAAPEGLLDNFAANAVAATHFTLADGVYSAGLRNGMPEPVIREAIQLLESAGDLKAALPADEAIRALYVRDFRGKSKTSGKIIYVGLTGSAGKFDCYSFEAADGAFRCFDPKIAMSAPTSAATNNFVPLPPSRTKPRPQEVVESGAVSLHGVLAPIKGAPVTSLFGMRYHPILHIVRLHAGIDFGAPVGSPVRAAADGKVEIAGPVSGYGNHVRIMHDGFETSYSHLSEILEGIHPGVEVKQGEIIAYSGNTGLSTGPHLHFEYHVDGVAVDPLPHLGTEIQATAPSVAQIGETHLVAASAPSPTGASEAEIVAFSQVKMEVDAALEAAVR
jgi:murein DD-endopeptidase MepM/ murein hydrolase activator NlpD